MKRIRIALVALTTLAVLTLGSAVLALPPLLKPDWLPHW